MTPQPSKLVFIVARDRLRLHQSFVEMFSDEDDIEILFDRRLRERRQIYGAHVSERRRGERRSQPEIDGQLRARGYAKVVIDLARS
jgi:hypothetical protein